MDAERFVRQILVDGIGERGQENICVADARVGGRGLAHEVAGHYAEAAGFARVEPAAAPFPEDVPSDWVVDPAARATLGGARATLRAILACVREDGEEGRAR